MGDYAEYYIEQQEEEQFFSQLVNHDPYRRSLMCWIDEIAAHEIWHWYPGCRIFGWMSRIHEELKIGTKSFLARNIYPAYHQELLHSSSRRPLQIINGIVYEVTGSESDARFDIIILSQSDLSSLKREAQNLANSAKDMKEELFAEMLDAIATFLEKKPSIKEFVIYREL